MRVRRGLVKPQGHIRSGPRRAAPSEGLAGAGGGGRRQLWAPRPPARQIRDPRPKPCTLGSGGGGAEGEALGSATYATTRALRRARVRGADTWGSTERCCTAACMAGERCDERAGRNVRCGVVGRGLVPQQSRAPADQSGPKACGILQPGPATAAQLARRMRGGRKQPGLSCVQAAGLEPADELR